MVLSLYDDIIEWDRFSHLNTTEHNNKLIILQLKLLSADFGKIKIEN